MPTPTPGAGGGTADVTIQIVGMAGANSFNPNPASVKAGQTVSWHNADMVGHTATGSGFDTGVIAPGATSAPITFGTVGALSYRCAIHPSMTGTLNVTP
jgi:plastocyanin